MRSWTRYKETVHVNWHLGLTCFGGPAVQFQTFHKMFVEEKQWIDEKMFQQIFCLSQSLPGSASVKMLLCINAIRNGLVAGFLAFLMFSLPGAIGMYALGIGVSHMGTDLPAAVYSLLSGLNAATVGVIALAGVKLAHRAIDGKLTRLLVYLGGSLGMLYTALWYYPALMIVAGIATFTWEGRYIQNFYGACKSYIARRQRRGTKARTLTLESQERSSKFDSIYLNKALPRVPSVCTLASKRISSLLDPHDSQRISVRQKSELPLHQAAGGHKVTEEVPAISWQLGSLILLIFSLTFVLFTTLHIVLKHLDRLFELFSSLYLAGTIIFGGGPVVIPLLRSYIVQPGWVSSRDFLLGIAIIQAFPGPNFNFVVYLGVLTALSAGQASYLGALISFVAMYVPGLFIVVGFMGLWRIMQSKTWFLGTLKGVNAAAVGLVFTAVWKLWEMGRLSPENQEGESLGGDAWLVLITASAYVGGAWFKVDAPFAIIGGGILNVARWGVVSLVNG